MHVAHTIEELRRVRRGMLGTLGLVPTMGCLHEGHLSLVRGSVVENSATVVSIFVNPTQFGKGEDFQDYPRDTKQDLRLLEKEGVDVAFVPEAEQIYPPEYSTWVHVERVTERLEGASRPGHFRGVATVCNKLFNIVQPTVAYFGQKDAQQVVVLKRMVRDLDMDLEIRVLPTVRDEAGVAVSSRNIYLKGAEHKAARILSQALTEARVMHSQGERNAEKMRRCMASTIAAEPLATVDYVSIADAESLDELNWVDRPAFALVAARIGKARLIDNIMLG